MYSKYTISMSNLSQPLIYINQLSFTLLHRALYKIQYTMLPQEAVVFHSTFSLN